MREYKAYTPKDFSTRRITNDQAMKVLKKHGLVINEEEAGSILSLLYLLAKTTSFGDVGKVAEQTPLGEIEPERR